jgi:protein phosphatase methylesterase 1
LAKEVVRLSKGECGILAFDARRHGIFLNLTRDLAIYLLVYSGKTTPLSGAEDSDLHIDTITTDLVALLVSVFSDPKTAPTLILVGHSMGGAACVKACPILQEKKYSVSGVAVLDVVEGEHHFMRELTVLT